MSGRELELTVPPERAGQCVSTVLRGELGLSKRALQGLKWTPDAIWKNGRSVRATETVLAGDRLTVRLRERPGRTEPLPSGPPLNIVYEDDDLLVLDKPAGVSMHAKGGGSLADALRAHLGDGSAAHFVNRLDKGTSGLLLAAKSGYLHDQFRKLLHTDGLYREYRAVCAGCPEPPEGAVTLPLGPSEGTPLVRCVRPDGDPARSEYRVLERHGPYSLLQLVPRTGRTHQLRVHMRSLGCPLVGDILYGGPEDERIARPALHSCLLRFAHPLTGERLEFSSPLPDDIASLLK